MNIVINFIGATLLGLFALYVFWRKSRAKRINDFFSNAVRVYALTNEEDARIAIITAAKGATKTQRRTMAKYLQRIVAEIRKMGENNAELKPFTDKFAASSIELADEISSREWTTDDIQKQKELLGSINSDYLAALDKADPTIFTQKHPQLFK